MEQQQIFRYVIAACMAVTYLWFVSVIAYAAWKDSKK